MAQMLLAQEEAPADTVKRIMVDHADLAEYIQEGDGVIQRFLKNNRQVELRQGETFMYCDTAIIFDENQLIAYGKVLIQQGDSVNVFSDSLVYQGDVKIADLYGDVALTSGTSQLFTEQLNYDLNTKIAIYESGAILKNDSTTLISKKGRYAVNEKQAFFKDSVYVVSPDFTLRSDTLEYNTEDKTVFFVGPTVIRQDDARIYCESGFYDTQERIAVFEQNAEYIKENQNAVADVIRYDGNSKEIILEGNAQFVDGAQFAKADIIRVEEETEITTLIGNAEYRDSSQVVTSDVIRYDAVNEAIMTEGRSEVVDEDQILVADKIDYAKERGVGIATGNVVWTDTSDQITIVCEEAEYKKGSDYLKAYGNRPMLISVMDGDSLFMTADTLVSFQQMKYADPNTISQPDSLLQMDSLSVLTDSLSQVDSLYSEPEIDLTLPDSLTLDSLGLDSMVVDSIDLIELGPPIDSARVMLAYADVRIFKSDLQAVCDSLVYDTKDSIFYFFQDPVIWSDTTQFFADSIQMTMQNEQIHRIFMRKDALIINSTDEVFFNQIKGKDITAYFAENEVKKMHVEGNAESVYYAQNDSMEYIGVNKTVCSEMWVLFTEGELTDIRFYEQPQATLFPMQQVNHNSLRLENFKWIIERRPNSVEDLLVVKTVVIPKVEEEMIPVEEKEVDLQEDAVEEDPPEKGQ